LHFTGTNKALSRLLLINCKELKSVTGLANLEQLNAIRVSPTVLDIDQTVAANLPPWLKVFAFYTGKSAENEAIRIRIDQLGYSDGLD
jgi:hypothetical protein